MLRLSDRSAYDRVSHLWRVLGAPRPNQIGHILAARLIEPLASLTGIPAEQLVAIAYWPSRYGAGMRWIRFFGVQLSNSLLELGSPKVCPVCLQEDDAFRRALWDLSYVEACPVHGVWLVRHCPDCGRRSQWCNAHLRSCACGRAFARCKVEPCGDGVRALTRLIAHASPADARDQLDPSAATAFPSELSTMPLVDLLELIIRIGNYASSGSISDAPRQDFRDRRRAVMAAADLLAAWPESFIALLDNRHTKSSRRLNDRAAWEWTVSHFGGNPL